MSRRYSDPVEVRVGVPQIGRRLVLPAGLDGASVPTAFLWRGRLHVVQAVLEHWTQRLPWWRMPWSEQSSEVTSAGASESGATGGQSEETPGALRVRTSFPELEREVWRVEASAGRLMQTGVYDLTKDDRWRLVRVAD
ncbi:DUF6504 family protein [Ornithinimicrobium murale]|uniref:DUF6504 family protein n=1 Tax=Ornithinimicrobium murale TaxID=1050153 RepID=UPI000E0D5A4C|nr:DUF6504 family protein [Ornithinimicrobium murale]